MMNATKLFNQFISPRAPTPINIPVLMQNDIIAAFVVCQLSLSPVLLSLLPSMTLAHLSLSLSSFFSILFFLLLSFSQNPSAKMFDTAQEECFRLMHLNCYHPFLQSRFCQQYLHNKRKKLLKRVLQNANAEVASFSPRKDNNEHIVI
jgi:hypothetical protein